MNMKDYLMATEEELAETEDTAAFVCAMALRLPRANLLLQINEINAAVY
jgi:hypothetical protein